MKVIVSGIILLLTCFVLVGCDEPEQDDDNEDVNYKNCEIHEECEKYEMIAICGKRGVVDENNNICLFREYTEYETAKNGDFEFIFDSYNKDIDDSYNGIDKNYFNNHHVIVISLYFNSSESQFGIILENIEKENGDIKISISVKTSTVQSFGPYALLIGIDKEEYSEFENINLYLYRRDSGEPGTHYHNSDGSRN